MELKDTVELMLSNDWKDRLKAEYWQTKIRWVKLNSWIVKCSNDSSIFSPKCSFELIAQYIHMYNYLCNMEKRAEISGVDLGLKDLDGEL